MSAAANNKFIAFVKRNPIGVSCVLISIAIGAALYFRWGKIAVAEADRDAKEEQSNRLAQNKENAFNLKDQLDRLSADNEAINSRLLKLSQGGASYTGYFYRIAEGVPGLAVNQVSPGAASKAALGPLAYTVVVNGSYNQLMNFLRRLEGGSNFCRVTNLHLSTSGRLPEGNIDPANDKLTLRLDLQLLGQQ